MVRFVGLGFNTIHIVKDSTFDKINSRACSGRPALGASWIPRSWITEGRDGKGQIWQQHANIQCQGGVVKSWLESWLMARFTSQYSRWMLLLNHGLESCLAARFIIQYTALNHEWCLKARFKGNIHCIESWIMPYGKIHDSMQCIESWILP